MKSSKKSGPNTDAKKGMTRRELLKFAAVSAPLLHGGLGSGATASHGLPFKNVIVFITDQERYIQHFPEGWECQNLPGLTRLKQNGLSFENAFTNACMCSPARSTFFSGYFPAQHGVKYTLEENMTNLKKNPQVQLPVEMKNVATVMASVNFNVVYKGKWHCSKPAGPQAVPADLAKYGFYRWNPPDAGANQDPNQAGGGETVIESDLPHDQRIMFGVPYGQEGAMDYLRSVAVQQQPFFLVVSLVNPHDVLAYPLTYDIAQPDGFGYDDSVTDGNIGIPLTIREDLSTKPTVQQQFLDLTNVGLGFLPTPKEQQDYLNFYGNLMKASDAYLCKLLDLLIALGLLEDTLIIRTADHGEMGLTHDGQRQKNFNFYEESTRVPLVYSNPNLYTQAYQSDAIVSHVDFLPTLAGLFKAPAWARAHWQGVDYSSLILNPSAPPVQDYTVFTYDDYQSGQKNGPYPDPPNHIVSIREARYKLAEYFDEDGSVESQFEMYDRLTDPYERINLAWTGYQRNKVQQAEFVRLQAKLAFVRKIRLLPFN
jgi:arylsulfatase A-like enzyme